VIWSSIPKRIGSSTRIGVRERKFEKRKESKKEEKNKWKESELGFFSLKKN